MKEVLHSLNIEVDKRRYFVWLILKLDYDPKYGADADGHRGTAIVDLAGYKVDSIMDMNGIEVGENMKMKLAIDEAVEDLNVWEIYHRRGGE